MKDPQPNDCKPNIPARRFRRALIALPYLAFVVMNFLPIRGKPQFKYEGSGSAEQVWNIGWPVAPAIYDARDGFHFHPTPWFLLPWQVLFLVILSRLVALANKSE